MKKPTKFDFLVFIGRFQPYHHGHHAVLTDALQHADQVIVLTGSAHQARSVRNPWTPAEREIMIRSAFDEASQNRLHIAPLMDNTYNDDAWVRSVQTTVAGIVTAHHSTPHSPARVGLIGHQKDQTSFYLNLFPQWGAIGVDNRAGINATDIRNKLFASDDELNTDCIAAPSSTISYLNTFRNTDEFQELQSEYQFVEKYRQAWTTAPYEPTFVTVDALVIQSGHVLLVERKARPGKGLLALPGGFVDSNEKLVDACIRELREETRLKVPEPVIKGSIKQQHVFDDPYRSARGRTITHVYHIEMSPQTSLPRVKGGDDAKHAFWRPLGDIDPREMFEDHYDIIRAMTGI